MIPNIHELRREMAVLRLAAGLRQESSTRPPHFVANIAGFLLKLGSGLKQLDTHEKQVMYDH